MTKRAVALVCLVLAGNLPGQRVFAQTPATNFVPMPADIICSLRQTGEELTSHDSPEHGTPYRLVDLTCSIGAAAPKDIDLASDRLADGILSTREFGDFHITGFQGLDATGAAAMSTSDGSLSITIASDQVDLLRTYLKP